MTPDEATIEVAPAPLPIPPDNVWRRWPWTIAALIVLLAIGGQFWATRIERDPRLLGDWYSNNGSLFRFHPDGRFQHFLNMKGGLTPWYMQQWRTRGDRIEVTSAPSGWKQRWNQFLGLFRQSNIQVIGFSGTNYRIVELTEAAMVLQRITPPGSIRIPPAETFSRTPPVLPPGPAAVNAGIRAAEN
ncbi:hypothetical protein Pan44_22900 [Caulifigura coniformis]|uniref:Uncharacterized protein n=1 Tax=Caulifigura coniformis TaxID=2527983 RepID=A0A517SDQ6_9PLAN|nr:hypothetical protein [Caulifigura coniformis]QDT54262.1 hypothetical protein Pan44_22900 [Caulifigura coniformis]